MDYVEKRMAAGMCFIEFILSAVLGRGGVWDVPSLFKIGSYD